MDSGIVRSITGTWPAMSKQPNVQQQQPRLVTRPAAQCLHNAQWDKCVSS